MTTGSIGPGTVLAGRYRLDDLLAETGGARFWRATDTVLARSVAIHAVPSDDSRAVDLLKAARVSATVVDPHLLRVLDCDDTEGISWVVHEWGDGISLDLMLQHGPLSPSRAAWLTREVAEAIASGHAQGVAHGRLNPEAVLVTHAGAVKLIGYVVDASLQTTRPADPLYGEIDEREADVVNLAGILYASLTGRWPGVAPSAVPAAPREASRPLRPRQVRAGVPRGLDAICERVLHKEASRHALPIETAHEICAALSDYVGDPGTAAPLDPAALHDEPAVSNQHPSSAAEPEAQASPRDQHTEPTQVSRLPDTGSEATQVSRLPDTGSEATQIAHEPSPRSLAPLQPPAREQPPPPPPFEDLPDRPLFAPGERRVPPGAATAGQQASGSSGWGASASPGAATGLAEDATGTSGGAATGFWPFTEEDEERNEVHTGREGRGWLRTAIVVAVLIVVLVAMVVAFNIGRGDGTLPGGEGPEESPSQSERSSQPLQITGVQDFDPEGDPDDENADEVGRAVDDDPASAWTTMTYRGRPDLGGLKSGVGLMLDLGQDQEVRSVTVRFRGTPTSMELYAASKGVNAAPSALDQLDKVGAQADAGARTTVQLDPATTTRYLLVWLTELPAVSGGFRGEIADVTVRS